MENTAMITTIQIPSPVYTSAERLAQQLDVSLSELYTVALSAYINAHQQSSVTEALNRVYATESSDLEPALVALQAASIGDEPW